MSKIIFTYKTILEPAQVSLKERGSRFLAFGFPVADTDLVKKHLRQLKKEHPKANHHCFAFRLGTDGLSFRTNDDGEPPGSAGKPILGQIDRLALTDVLVVVVRYFGGTLLGIPGLMNAYKTVAADCLSIAEIVEKNVEYKITVECNYLLLNEVMKILRQYEAHIYRQEMLLFCMFTVGIPLAHKEACLAHLESLPGMKISLSAG